MKNTGFRDKNGQINGLATGYQTENKEKALTEQKLLSKESYEKIYTPNEKNMAVIARNYIK